MIDDWKADKTPGEVLKALFETWFTKFGAPNHIIHDLGREFTSKKWTDLLVLLALLILHLAME